MKTQTNTAKHTQGIGHTLRDRLEVIANSILLDGGARNTYNMAQELKEMAQALSNNPLNQHDQLIAQRDALRDAASKVCEAVANCLPISGNGPVDALYYKQKLMEIDKATGDLSFELTKINLCEPKDKEGVQV